MKDHKQATGGTSRPNGNDFKGNPVNVAKCDDSGLRPGVKVPGHKRGKQGKG